MSKESRIIPHLDPATQAEVVERFPLDYIGDYEKALHKVKRFGHSRHLPIFPPEFEESDLDHVVEMLDMLGELGSRFTHLRKAVNFRQTEYMIAMHDAGEIIVGDGAPFGAERDKPKNKRKKRQEPKMALRYILSQIPDPDTQEEMKHLFHRFERQKPDDKEALLVRFLDKAQATTRTAPIHEYDYRASGYRRPSAALVEHVESATSIFLGAALNLHRALPLEAGEEIRTFAEEELKRFEPIGFGRIAGAKIDDLNRATREIFRKD